MDARYRAQEGADALNLRGGKAQGPRHRIEGAEVTGMDFDGLAAHGARFRSEVHGLNDRR